MKSLIPILAALLLTTNVHAAQQWRQKPVLCENNENAAQEFYRENNLVPDKIVIFRARGAVQQASSS